MRKNVKQQFALRVLSTAALMAMVSSIATAAFADTYDVTKGSVDILAEGGKQYITQWEDKDNNLCVKDGEGKDIRDREDSKIVLTTKDETTGETKTTSNTVTIDAKDGNTANVTLENVHIEVDTTDAKSGAIEIKGDGDTNLELNGDNTVLVENRWSEEHAAIEKADKYGTGTLTIKDDVNDNGTAKTGTDEDTTGKLLAGGYHNSAAIGGGSDSYNREYSLADTSNITITGGKITAIAGNDGAAAIGGGYDGTGKNIRIKGNAMLLPFPRMVLRSAVVSAVETASPLRTMPLLMLVLLLPLRLEMAIKSAAPTTLLRLRSPEMPPYMQKPVKAAAPLVLVGMAAVLISRSILKRMPMLQLLLPVIVLRLEMLAVTVIPQQPSTSPAAP